MRWPWHWRRRRRRNGDVLAAIQDAERQRDWATRQTSRVDWTAWSARELARRADRFITDTEQSWRYGGGGGRR